MPAVGIRLSYITGRATYCHTWLEVGLKGSVCWVFCPMAARPGKEAHTSGQGLEAWAAYGQERELDVQAARPYHQQQGPLDSGSWELLGTKPVT